MRVKLPSSLYISINKTEWLSNFEKPRHA